jgi:hypothetical protein
MRHKRECSNEIYAKVAPSVPAASASRCARQTPAWQSVAFNPIGATSFLEELKNCFLGPTSHQPVAAADGRHRQLFNVFPALKEEDFDC